MLKNMLKSSVSVLTLLAVITNVSPSQAGKNSSQKGDEKKGLFSRFRSRFTTEKPQEPKSEGPKTALIPFKAKPNFGQDELKKLEDTNGTLIGGGFIPLDILHHVFTFLDTKDALNAQLVCKNWQYLIQVDQKKLRHYWSELHKGKPLTLPPFIQHPHSILWISNQLAPQFPVAYSRLGDVANSEITFPEEIMDQFAHVLNQSPQQESFLTRVFLGLDPLNIREVGLAAHIIKNSKGMQALLKEKAASQDIFKDKFFESLRKPEDFSELHQQLMALKLLAIGGDEDAKKQMIAFSQGLLTHLHVALPDLEKDFKPSPSLLYKFSLPFYTDDDTFLKHSNNYVFWLAYSYMHKPDANIYKKIKLYWETLFPLAKYSATKFLRYRILHESIKSGKEKANKELDESLNEINKKDLPSLIDIADNYIELDLYQEATHILEDALRTAEQSPFRFFILLKLAKCILSSEDSSKFHQAERYLQDILQNGIQGQGHVQTPYSFIPDEKDEPIHHDEDVGMLDVSFLMAALQIYKGEFDAAYITLRGIDDDEYEDNFDDFEEIFLKALKPHLKNPNLPKKLIKLLNKHISYELGESFDYLAHFHPSDSVFLKDAVFKYSEKYKDVIDFLQKGHPLDKLKMHKVKRFAKKLKKQEKSSETLSHKYSKEEE